MAQRILIVEDDANIRAGLVDALEFEGYETAETGDGGRALEIFGNFRPDLVILDLMLPVLNGYEICRRLRRDNIQVPVIILTAKNEEIDKVLGLELGADDYVTKPFGIRELLARIAALLRRAGMREQPVPDAMERFKFAGWEVDPATMTAVNVGRRIDLSLRELELLKLFAAHPGEVLSRERIMVEVWGNALRNSRTLDQHLVALRRKIELSARGRLIESVYGVGYRFTPPPAD